MPKGGRGVTLKKLVEYFNSLSNFPVTKIANLLFNLGEHLNLPFSGNGIYEVEELETILEIHDSKGVKATVNKRQKVRYLQDHIIAYQDQAWGDGEILVNYKCAPGVPVDQYQFGHKTIILISLRAEKNKNDIDEFKIQWNIRDGFIRNTESWSTAVQHKTKKLVVKLIFPKSRPPLSILLVEGKQKRTSYSNEITKSQLPDGRWEVNLQKFKPKLDEEYILEWTW